MKEIRKIVGQVLENPENYPECMVNSCQLIANYRDRRVEAVVALRGEYKEIRNFWLRATRQAKPEINTKTRRLRAASFALSNAYGHSAYATFTRLNHQLRNAKEYRHIEEFRVLAMMRILSGSAEELYSVTRGIYANRIERSNYENFMLGHISDAVVSQILAFRLMVVEQNR